jgi:hypothetical protein
MQAGDSSTAWHVLKCWSTTAPQPETAAVTATAATKKGAAAPGTAAGSVQAPEHSNRLFQALSMMHGIYQQEQAAAISATAKPGVITAKLTDLCITYCSCVALLTSAAAAATTPTEAAHQQQQQQPKSPYSYKQMMWLATLGLQLGVPAAAAGLHDLCLQTMKAAAAVCCCLLQPAAQQQQQQQGRQGGAAVAAAEPADEQDAGANVSALQLSPAAAMHVSLRLAAAVAVAVPLLLRAHASLPSLSQQQLLLRQARQLLGAGQLQMQQLDAAAAAAAGLERVMNSAAAAEAAGLQHQLLKLSFVVACREQQEPEAKRCLQELVEHPSTSTDDFQAAAAECLRAEHSWRSETLAALAYGFMLRLAAAAKPPDAGAALSAGVGIVALDSRVSHGVKVRVCSKVAAVLQDVLSEQQQLIGGCTVANAAAVESGSKATEAVLQSAAAAAMPAWDHAAESKLQWLLSTCWNAAVAQASTGSNATVAQQYLDCAERLAQLQASPQQQQQQQGHVRQHWLLQSRQLAALKALLAKRKSTSKAAGIAAEAAGIAAGSAGRSEVDQQTAPSSAEVAVSAAEEAGKEHAAAGEAALTDGNTECKEDAEYAEASEEASQHTATAAATVCPGPVLNRTIGEGQAPQDPDSEQPRNRSHDALQQQAHSYERKDSQQHAAQVSQQSSQQQHSTPGASKQVVQQKVQQQGAQQGSQVVLQEALHGSQVQQTALKEAVPAVSGAAATADSDSAVCATPASQQHTTPPHAAKQPPTVGTDTQATEQQQQQQQQPCSQVLLQQSPAGGALVSAAAATSQLFTSQQHQPMVCQEALHQQFTQKQHDKQQGSLQQCTQGSPQHHQLQGMPSTQHRAAVSFIASHSQPAQLANSQHQRSQSHSLLHAPAGVACQGTAAAHTPAASQQQQQQQQHVSRSHASLQPCKQHQASQQPCSEQQQQQQQTQANSHGATLAAPPTGPQHSSGNPASQHHSLQQQQLQQCSHLSQQPLAIASVLQHAAAAKPAGSQPPPQQKCLSLPSSCIPTSQHHSPQQQQLQQCSQLSQQPLANASVLQLAAAAGPAGSQPSPQNGFCLSQHSSQQLHLSPDAARLGCIAAAAGLAICGAEAGSSSQEQQGCGGIQTGVAGPCSDPSEQQCAAAGAAGAGTAAAQGASVEPLLTHAPSSTTSSEQQMAAYMPRSLLARKQLNSQSQRDSACVQLSAAAKAAAAAASGASNMVSDVLKSPAAQPGSGSDLVDATPNSPDAMASSVCGSSQPGSSCRLQLTQPDAVPEAEPQPNLRLQQQQQLQAAQLASQLQAGQQQQQQQQHRNCHQEQRGQQLSGCQQGVASKPAEGVTTSQRGLPRLNSPCDSAFDESGVSEAVQGMAEQACCNSQHAAALASVGTRAQANAQGVLCTAAAAAPAAAKAPTSAAVAAAEAAAALADTAAIGSGDVVAHDQQEVNAAPSTQAAGAQAGKDAEGHSLDKNAQLVDSVQRSAEGSKKAAAAAVEGTGLTQHHKPCNAADTQVGMITVAALLPAAASDEAAADGANGAEFPAASSSREDNMMVVTGPAAVLRLQDNGQQASQLDSRATGSALNSQQCPAAGAAVNGCQLQQMCTQAFFAPSQQLGELLLSDGSQDDM